MTSSYSRCHFIELTLTQYRDGKGKKDVTIQLLGKDDPSFDDSNVQSGRWDAYVKSFIAVSAAPE